MIDEMNSRGFTFKQSFDPVLLFLGSSCRGTSWQRVLCEHS